jgi:hypothetical protein
MQQKSKYKDFAKFVAPFSYLIVHRESSSRREPSATGSACFCNAAADLQQSGKQRDR